jgi:Ni/Co efflux regulator RcnB
MLFKRNAWIYILFALLIPTACASSKLTASEKQNRQANKSINKSQRKEARLKKRESQKAKKRHWKNQSHQYKLSIKRNKKRLKIEKSKKGKEINDFF